MRKHLLSKLLFWIGGALLLAMLAVIGFGFVANQSPHFPHADLAIQKADGQRIPYSVEVATTPEQQEYGLMFRYSMPAKTGMLFLFEPDRRAVFWMKNTKILLDMVFVRADGTISSVYPRAKVDDLTRIQALEPVRAVIEINGGEAESLNIKAGDKVIYPGLGAQ